jgi:Immunity protein family (Imm11)
MDPRLTGGRAAGDRIENKMTLTQGRGVLYPPIGARGFPAYSEPPRVLIDKKFGRPLRDLEECNGYWLIPDRMKKVLESVDAEGFTFVECEVYLRGGEPGPRYWLCDVVRVLDAVDEEASRLRIYDEQDYKSYSLMGGANLVFNEHVVGSAHIFRMAYLEPVVICDWALKEACKAAALKGIAFHDAANYGGGFYDAKERAKERYGLE